VNLRWDATFRRFIAEFSSDFQGDLAAVKAAGFKPDTSSGSWVWWTGKAAPLTKLRENRPASGLTITSEAKEQYAPLAAMEAKNTELKAEIAKANKELKKKLKQSADSSMPEKGYIDASDLPPLPPLENPYVRPPQDPNAPRCIVCKGLLELFLYGDDEPHPLACLWCQKSVLEDTTII
jgi:hypothetical protein